MKYDVKYVPATEELAVPTYRIACLDKEAVAFMKAINKELKRLAASKKREAREGFKEGFRSMPHVNMKKDKNEFCFDSIHADDVCAAARNARGQNIKASFLSPAIEIAESVVENFERAVDEKRE